MKKVNFLGMDFNVVDDDDVAQAAELGQHHDYMVMRVEDSSNAGSPDLLRRRQRTLCEKCGAVCWIDPKSHEQVASLNHTIICSRCMLKKVEKDQRDA